MQSDHVNASPMTDYEWEMDPMNHPIAARGLTDNCGGRPSDCSEAAVTDGGLVVTI